MYKLNGTNNSKQGNIFYRAEVDRLNTSYTLPGTTSFLATKPYKIMHSVPNGISEVALLSAISDKEVSNTEEGMSADLTNLQTLLTPPNEKFSDIIPPEGIALAQQVEGLATKQFIQQFYEVYMAPLGLKDVYNRLGAIAGNIADIHMLYPNGLKGLIAADARGSWRTNLNFAFNVDTGLKKANGEAIVEKYSSLAFPPFIQHETLNANDFLQTYKSPSNEKDAVKDQAFDMDNLLYKKNAATFRFPAFKQVNDNIHILQVLLNRCFGVESTFINEWDLSMYMQEGLTSFIEKADQEGTIVRLPQFVTTLTYGLLDDAPLDQLKQQGKNTGYSDINLDQVAPFASVNMAVSTRFAIDNQPIGQKANESIYIIGEYPYSAYWYPWDSGVRFDELNVSNYIDNFFSFRVNGLAYDESRPETLRNYTPAIFHGDLSKSTKDFRNILNYTDDRYAVLSGWNATDENGENYLRDSDSTNESVRSNAYSYLPFWKQFYTTGDDGMSEVDLYLQEVMATDKECSFINSAFQIINLTTGSNSAFNDECEKHAKEDFESKIGRKLGEDESFNLVVPSKFGAASDNYKDMKFSLFKCKLTIPGSKLLNMFLNRKKSKNKAMAAASSQTIGFSYSSSGSGSDAGTAGGATASPVNALKNSQPSKAVGSKKIVVDGKEVEVTEYSPTDNDELCSKKVVGDGIAEFSPFLFGGPHGKYYSPLTLEGYCQVGNQTLANVPTVDIYSTFEGIQNNMGVRGFEFSKNYKLNGSYIDSVIALTPNEKEALTQGSAEFGVKGMKPNTRHIMPYTSNRYVREYYHDWSKWIRIRIGFIKIRIPNFWYFKLLRSENGRHRNFVLFTKDYGTGHYTTRSHTTRVEYNVSYQEDWWNEDFRLLPTCGWEPGFTTQNTWDLGTTLNHIRHDQSRFLQHASWTNDTAGNINYTWRPSHMHIGSDCVKWMVVPSNISGGPVCGAMERQESSDTRYLHWSPYSAKGSKWYEQLKKLWHAGTRECSVTLPIKDTAGRIIELMCGVVNIYKSKAIAWGWVIRWHRAISYRHSWGCPHEIIRYWWNWNLRRVPQDTYNMYFRPEKIQWILPTDVILNREAKFTDQRDPNSSNIIEKWNTDGAVDWRVYRFSHLSDTREAHSPILFPFTEAFIQKYGRYEPNTLIPGVSTWQHARYMGSLKVLHTKGLYYGDIMETYIKTGEVQSIVSIYPLWQQWRGPVYYTDTAAGVRYASGWLASLIRLFFGGIYIQSSRFGVEREVLWTADYPIWGVSKRARQPELTKILDSCQSWNVIQEYQIGNTPYMTWYKPKDAISVYIDTATQQLSWLKQLRDYADNFLKDYLIYEVYEKSVDNRVKAIIEYNFNGDVKNGQDYKNATGGWTSSFTEDINYHDALAIVRRVFKTSNRNSNTIYDLTVDRIKHLESLKKAAQGIYNGFETNPTLYMHRFMRLVTNTKSYLDGATTNGGASAKDTIFDAAGNYRPDVLYEIDSSTTYNMLTNPAAVLWAYINVLYHVRKYWVNMRFNKRAGSYWQLRGLERVLTFMLASNTGEDSPTSPEKHIEQGLPLELRTKAIQYVQPRKSFDEQLEEFGKVDKDIVYTKAVYVKVDYCALPDPKDSPKWNEEAQTYDGKELTWVEEKFKYAYKPNDDLYYVMSTTISDTITNYTNILKDTITTLYSKEYEVSQEDMTQMIPLFSAEEQNWIKQIIRVGASLESSETGIKLLAKDAKYDDLHKIFTDFVNALIVYKRDFFMTEIRKWLFPVYIRWRPEHVWTGLQEDDAKGNWHIDEWQYKDTFGKDRKVTDLYGKEHTHTEPISAGITFDVVAGLNPETLLSSPKGLRDSSVLEILCSCVDRMDLWRIEIPEDLNIPVNVLEDKPILVPAYQIDASVNGLKPKTSVASKKSVLVGAISSSVVPIVEAQESLLTINSLSALGEFNQVSLSDLGVGTDGNI